MNQMQNSLWVNKHKHTIRSFNNSAKPSSVVVIVIVIMDGMAQKDRLNFYFFVDRNGFVVM